MYCVHSARTRTGTVLHLDYKRDLVEDRRSTVSSLVIVIDDALSDGDDK
jgi:hypothetical protein